MAELEPELPNADAGAEIPQLKLRIAQLEEQMGAVTAALRGMQSASVRPPVVQTRPVLAGGVALPPRVAPPPSLAQPAARASLETQVGSRVLSKVSVILLLIGVAYFLKWAFENRWIGPSGRVIVGLLAGAAVVVWSERFRRKGMAAFSYALKAVGSGVLYLSLWAAFHLYALMPSWLALLAMIAVTGWNAYMAVAQDAELLAGYALLGAYVTPALLSTGGDHEVFLFTYLLVIAAAVAVLLRVKNWPRLLLGALPVTVGYFIAWYVAHFEAEKAAVTIAFALLLWAAFAVVPLIARAPDDVIAGVLMPMFAAAFGALSVYSVLADSGGLAAAAWWAVGFGAVYLLATRVRRESVAASIHLSLGVVFLTVAIPLKATGHGITAAWLAEALALLWVSTLPNVARRAVTALRWLACGSLLLGVAGALVGNLVFPTRHAFLNRNFATSIGAELTLAAAIFLAGRMLDANGRRFNGEAIAAVSLVLLNVVLLASMHHEIFLYAGEHAAVDRFDEMYRIADFSFSAWMMVQGASMLAIGFWRRVALARWIGLMLLVATVIKAFAYDMRSLGTGYRVVSYLALGVVLMAVSFAYQKDWLNLKETVPPGIPPVPQPAEDAR